MLRQAAISDQKAGFSTLLGFLFVVVFLITTERISAQEFTSQRDATWQDVATWTTAGNCGQNQNPSTGFPPISKNWGCGVSVFINHQVAYTGNASGFGSGVFASVSIASAGKLTFKGDLTINGGGSVPTFQLSPGAEFHVEGTFTLDRPVLITIPAGSRMVVNALVIGNNSPVITVEEGGELIVHKTTTLRSRSTLNLSGKFLTKDLSFTSGGTVNASDPLASISVEGDLTVSNGTLNLGSSAKLEVAGKTDVGQSGTIDLRESASAMFAQQVSIPNGATFRSRNAANFRFDEGLEMSGGGKLILSDQASGIIVKDVSLPNGEIQTGNAAELNVGGRLVASNGGRVTTTSSSSVFICDYPNSTQLGTYHVSRQGDSFYGTGCIPLPVLWKSTQATFQQTKRQVHVGWVTAAEKNNSHFVIERSVSGIQGFHEVKEVAAVGWSDVSSEYQFLDTDLPLMSGMIYYRIRQVDFDGKSAFSEVFGVQVENSSLQHAGRLIAYPNPTNGDKFQIRFEHANVGTHTVTATFKSWGGSKLLKAESLETLSLMVAEEIRLAPKGLCMIEVVADSQVHHLKVMKL
ncbi:hypothetical protein [Lunatimonas salinarum]|uniref:hypothetical protein n=1 Tax=Lunatimonas salinarum TaxID=1774590 RepID=UPI001ADEE98D|nr:hypothetical protein [Lunatimonas salinarum]